VWRSILSCITVGASPFNVAPKRVPAQRVIITHVILSGAKDLYLTANRHTTISHRTITKKFFFAVSPALAAVASVAPLRENTLIMSLQAGPSPTRHHHSCHPEQSEGSLLNRESPYNHFISDVHKKFFLAVSPALAAVASVAPLCEIKTSVSPEPSREKNKLIQPV